MGSWEKHVTAICPAWLQSMVETHCTSSNSEAGLNTSCSMYNRKDFLTARQLYCKTAASLWATNQCSHHATEADKVRS